MPDLLYELFPVFSKRIGTMTDSNELQSSNVEFPINLTESGIITDFNELRSEKDLLGRSSLQYNGIMGLMHC